VLHVKVFRLVLFAAALAFAPAALAQPHCQPDTMGNTYCAKSPGGVAVIDGLGQVACAPGACVNAGRDEVVWRCSPVDSGWAQMGENGPECQGGCVDPSPNECQESEPNDGL
jgi:hypothetical protein